MYGSAEIITREAQGVALPLTAVYSGDAYIADENRNVVRAVNLTTGSETVVAGINSIGQSALHFDFAALEKSADHAPNFAQIELRAGRARSAIGDARELQAGRRQSRARGYELQRVGAHRGIALVFEHFEPVDHRAHGAHKVVAYARHEHRREIEIAHG